MGRIFAFEGTTAWPSGFEDTSRTLVKGGKGEPDLIIGLGHQKMAMLISDLIIIKQCDVA